MKKIRLLILLFIVVNTAIAQEVYLWPIKDARPGADIISAPQEYIDGERNFGSLFIGAREGALVLAPADGVITNIGIEYRQSLVSSRSFRCENSFDHTLVLLKDVAKSMESKYLTGWLSIRVDDGKVLDICGLRGDIPFKTGQRIRRGDTLGYVGYSYRKIQEPSIHVEISLNSKPSDPMLPFGIESSFIAPSQRTPLTSFTKKQAKEDFKVCIEALEEAYPGLYHLLTPVELEQFVAETEALIESKSGNLTFSELRRIIERTVARIHDSHISYRSSEEAKCLIFQPQIQMGWINDTLYCTNATYEYSYLLGQQILSVNGISADSARRILTSYITEYDPGVKQYINYCLAVDGYSPMFFYTDDSPTFDMNIELADGEKVEIKGLDIRNNRPVYVANKSRFMKINHHQKSYVLKMLNASTAYIGLLNFSQNQVQIEEIARFIESISGAPNLIIDVRNNGGGDETVIQKIYSYIAGEPMVLQGYSKVNKRGGFECFKYSLNYPVGAELFPDFKAEAGRDGFYQYPEGGNHVAPDSAVNYKGRVYVLTNENSISAAALFPALLVKNGRGVVVGRETRTGYHFMNALKFVNIGLPNSMIRVRIPLVELYFDTAVNERVPFGRGVIPDYEVPLTLDEINYTGGDAILNYTMTLIEEGKYLANADLPDEPSTESPNCNTAIVVLGGICTAVALTIYIRRKRARKTNAG